MGGSGRVRVSSERLSSLRSALEREKVPLLLSLTDSVDDAEAALALQSATRPKRNGTAAAAAAAAAVVDEADEADKEEMAAEAKESEATKLLLSPGRAQAQAHCADPVLKVAGFKWCRATHQCLQSWEHECPGGEWNGGLQKEVGELTSQLAALRERKVRATIA